jgi:predicted GNAT superfamily acetyltransferase
MVESERQREEEEERGSEKVKWTFDECGVVTAKFDKDDGRPLHRI